MGLDVAFNRKAALKAGLVIEIVWSEYAEDEEEIVAVPGCEHFVSNDGAGDNIVVRANKWGNTYAPLTEWLTEHSIPWSEF